MYKIIFFIFLSLLSYSTVLAWGGTSTTNTTWNSSSWITECWQINSPLWFLRHGIPTWSQWNTGASWNRNCVARTYFTGWWYSDITHPSSWYFNRNTPNWCPNNMRAVRILYFMWDTQVASRGIGTAPYTWNNWNRYRLLCRHWDITRPTVSATNASNTWRNTNISLTRNVSDTWVNWGTAWSLVQARFAWASNSNVNTNPLNEACTAWGSTFSNWQSLTQSTNGDHMLYLCARDRGWNVRHWSGRYRLDKVSPTWTITYFDGWTNNTTQTVSFTYTDPTDTWVVNSWFRRYTLQRRVNNNNPNFPNWSWGSWSNVSWCVNQSTWTSCSAWSLSNHRAYQYRLIVQDFAWNQTIVTSNRVLRIDTTTPTVADIINTEPSQYLALNNQSYNFSVSNNWWAPIVEIRTVRERHNTQDININQTCNSWNCSVNWNISRVQNNFRQANGARPYRFRVTYIRDEAGNIWTGTQTYTHNVYANTSTMTSSLQSEQISHASNFAIWNQRNMIVRLRDTYNNPIVPAPGIGRTIDFQVNADNQLRLNQYNNNWNDSALFIGSNNNAYPIWPDESVTLSNQTSSNGDYTIPFFIFAPTSNRDALVPWQAEITSINYSINAPAQIIWWDRPQNISISDSSAVVSARPLYTTQFSWEIVDNWFIEWANQTSQLAVTRHNTTSISSPSLRFEFGEVHTSGDNIINQRFTMDLNSFELNEWTQTNWSTVTQVFSNLNPGNKELTSRMIQRPNSTPRDTTSYLASVVKYRISWRDIIYPQDIIWKDTYHGIQEGGQTFQRWVRIIGLTSSQRTEELTSEQFTNDARILWTLTKAELRRDIQRNVSQITRNIEETILWTHEARLNGTSWWGTAGWWLLLAQWNILYFKNPNQPVRLSWNIVWEKTLIVENWNVYIDGNVTGPWNLWIIVLHSDVMTWNVYINPSVRDIHASMFVDRSILSYNGSVLDGNTSATVLENQLYIYGSIFSENTIGTSRSTVPVCPFHVPSTSCTREEAQAYDFNYLRRYFINAGGDPSWWESVKRWNTDTSLRDYPLIIEYNPSIQSSPPPLFDIQR